VKIISQIKLQTTKEQHQALLATMRVFNLNGGKSPSFRWGMRAAIPYTLTLKNIIKKHIQKQARRVFSVYNDLSSNKAKVGVEIVSLRQNKQRRFLATISSDHCREI